VQSYAFCSVVEVHYRGQSKMVEIAIEKLVSSLTGSGHSMSSESSDQDAVTGVFLIVAGMKWRF
ncbi:hypothetical protein ACFLTA_04630, partial [Bacteroidota bacterium]